MIICEQCGNDFNNGRNIEKEGKKYIQCPYCKYLNEKVYRKKKRRDFNKAKKKDTY